jgi:MFS transporter, MHS family, proline/betaine transporter
MKEQGMSLKKLALIGFFGNVAEWYDFAVYAFLAVVIGDIFFASSSPQLALIKGFFLFSISYLARPIGSIFFGYLGDKFGRKKSLQLSLLMMAVPGVLIGLLPTYHTIGISAAFLLGILRFFQGFATGGEYPTIACYLYEAAPFHRRTFFGSIANASPPIGVLIGSFVVTILYVLLPQSVIYDWGWRIPFLLSFFVMLFIFYVRKGIAETAEYIHEKEASLSSPKKSAIFKELFKYRKSIFQALLMCIFLEISFYLLFVWFSAYLNVFLGLSSTLSTFLGSLGLLMLIIFMLLFGFFGEKYQPKKFVVFSILIIILTSYPLFLLLQLRILWMIIFVQLLFAIFLGCLCAVSMRVVGGLFSTKVRCLGLSVSVTFASGIFGGMAPTISSYLIHKTGWALSPVLFLIISGIIALPAVLTLKPENNG